MSSGLENYRKWLHWYVRNTYSGDWEDIAQEGWIAMWKALQTYDPTKGALPSWLTTAAKMRMSDVVRRHHWTGTPSVKGHVREKPATPVDPDWDWVDEKLERADAFAYVEMAYHHGEILSALSMLPPREKQWVVTNILEDAGRYSWRDAARRMKPSTKELLQQRLAHLAQ